MRLIAPVAAMPRALLEKLEPWDLPELRAAVQACADDPYEADTDTVVAEVLGVLAADPDVVAPEWLAALPLPDSGGEWVCADELLLPGSPLAQVLDEDSPFGSVDPEFVAEHGVATLRRLGAGSVINLGSTGWQGKGTGYPCYAIAKSSVNGLTRGLAKTLGQDRIRINTVSPGKRTSVRMRSKMGVVRKWL